MASSEREIALMRWLSSRGDGSALWGDVVQQFGDDPALADQLAALEARGLVQILDPFGTEQRAVLTEKGVAYLARLTAREPASRG